MVLFPVQKKEAVTGCGLHLENRSAWKGGFEVSVGSVTTAGLMQEAVGEEMAEDTRVAVKRFFSCFWEEREGAVRWLLSLFGD